MFRFPHFIILYCSVFIVTAIGCGEAKNHEDDEKVFHGTLEYIEQTLGESKSAAIVEIAFKENHTKLKLYSKQELTRKYEMGEELVVTYTKSCRNLHLVRIETKDEWAKRRHDEIVMPEGSAVVIENKENSE